jgi:adenylosuccinate synthase
MPVTVVVGGQFGSEGKGKVAHALALERRATVAIRVGGPNSGHTVIHRGEAIVLRQLPTASIIPGVLCVIPAGGYVLVDILKEEMKRVQLDEQRLVVDPNAVLITRRDVTDEQAASLASRIGSTESGTGAAVVARAGRTGGVALAKDSPVLKPFVKPVGPIVRARLDGQERVLIEGTQGFGLSLLHSPFYPFVTSRDTTAAGFVSEAGLSPLDVDDITLVLRAFPIRVAGNSGPLPNEIDWDELTRNSGNPFGVREFTSVTNKLRRVAYFDASVVRLAITHNRPSKIVLNHLDYVDSRCAIEGRLTPRASSFVREIEDQLGASVSHVGFGRDHLLAINPRKPHLVVRR